MLRFEGRGQNQENEDSENRRQHAMMQCKIVHVNDF
jgi:hypothetical protein